MTDYPADSPIKWSELHWQDESSTWKLSIQLKDMPMAWFVGARAWDEVEKVYGSDLLARFPSIGQQWQCHVLGSSPIFDTYDLEFSRPRFDAWVANVPGGILNASSIGGACNW